LDLLNSAIKAELRPDYPLALRYYRKLARQGAPLDRIGIYQAMARCFEKSGSMSKAGYWHEKAGQGYMRLPTRVMGQQERAYYGLIEFRSAVQDYTPDASMRKAAKNYMRALSLCLKAGKEGYSHEMLFAGHLSSKIKDFKRAAEFFADAAEQLKNEPKLARGSCELAARYYERSGNHLAAAKLRPLSSLP